MQIEVKFCKIFIIFLFIFFYNSLHWLFKIKINPDMRESQKGLNIGYNWHSFESDFLCFFFFFNSRHMCISHEVMYPFLLLLSFQLFEIVAWFLNDNPSRLLPKM